MPRWVLYQARSLAGSLSLMKAPPIPVTRFIVALSVFSNGSEDFCASLFCGFLSEVFAPEADSLLFSEAFTPEAGVCSWAWRQQQMKRVTTVKAVKAALVFIL